MEKLIINDKVHGNIELDGIYKELVECEEFQRLKDIIQTGTSYLKFPKMREETRFEHSIGSYYLMCKIIENIEKKLSVQGIKLSNEEKEIAKISMLLHDIGHGAYSHTLEKMTGISHEKRGISIVEDETTKINNILTKYYGKDFTNKVGEFLEQVYEHKHKKKSEIKIENNVVSLQDLFASLVSNNIDADRLDYLVRDSKYSEFQVLTQVDKLIEALDFVLDVDKVIVCIKEENKILIDMALLERARNYRYVYFCTPSVIGDNVLKFLLEELRNNTDQIDKNINPIVSRFLSNSKADFTNKEYMELTQTSIKSALEEIQIKTKNEMLRNLCDVEEFTKTYQELNTDKDENYIRYLLHKAVPQISENTKGIVEETRWIKPYKSNESENINIITSNGIEDYKDVKQDLINLEPFTKRTVAISLEMLRLELGVSKEEFDKNYKSIIEEVISTLTKSKDEFELRYVITKGIWQAEKIKEIIEQKYEIVDSAKYMSNDIYYDDKDSFELLDNKEALRIRRGTTLHNKEKTYGFKEKRMTYKKYKNDLESNFTIRRKEEEIGDSTRLKDYENFITSLGKDSKKLRQMLEVDNLRYLYTINVNGTLVDISFNTACYQSKIYKMSGNIGTIEIKPRDNKVIDRLSMLELKEFLEQKVPYLETFLSNTNVYEIGMLDTYEKYKKEQSISEDIDKSSKESNKISNKLEEISKKAKQRKDFIWLNRIPKVTEIEER